MSAPSHSPESLQISLGLQRTACDRCRRHKLKCNREPNLDQCHRCVRANERCFTSPARKAGRPQRLFRSQSPTTHAVLQTPPASTHHASPASLEQISPPEDLIPAFRNVLAGAINEQSKDSATTEAVIGVVEDRISQITRRSECMEALGILQSNILRDVDIVKGCRTAPTCLSASERHELGDPNPDFMIGQILNHTKTLLEILDIFDLSQDAAPYGAESSERGLYCDAPALFCLMSCYIGLIRAWRTIFACLHESIPFFQTEAMGHSTTQLLPNLDLGGFRLTGRIDLQLQILVQVCEDLLSKLDTKFGIGGGATTKTWNRSVGPNKATGLIWMLIEQEQAELLPLDQPRGHCGSLKEIFRSIRAELRMDHSDST